MSIDEYRYLTFLFCDLVDSTPMSQRLDAEDWRDILRAFQETCAAVIHRHGGQVHDSPGDGLLVYFGYPATHVDSAVHAVRAGIEIAHQGENLFPRQNRLLREAKQQPLRVRIGIHTGRVVIGRINGKDTATGFALPFTERLHRCAEPNTVVISQATFELVKSGFRVVGLGLKHLKGIDEPAVCYQALSEVDSMYRRRTPFVGRTKETGWLRQEYQLACPGRPRVLLISGEAGIGKSRLVDEFRDSHAQTARTLEWRCSPDNRYSAMNPVIIGIRHLLKTESGKDRENRVSQIEAMLPASVNREKVVPALASLLSIPFETHYAARYNSAERQKIAIQDALLEWLAHESRQKTLILIIEDVHWIDPSTLEFISRVANNHDTGPCLLLMTYRTEPSNTWSCPFAARPIDLGRLAADSARQMIAAASGGQELSDEAVQLLVDRTDGVPLFIEESAAMAVDQELHHEQQVSDPLPVPDRAAGVPLSLMDLLVARLDRVGSARDTAGLAAAIGREFSCQLLESVSPLSSSELADHLRILSDAGLVLAQTPGSADALVFKHALVRDAAYGTLLNSRRRDYHARIAESLDQEARHYQTVPPDVLAYHYTQAQIPERAIDLWLEAGLKARLKSEQFEAISHYQRIPDLLDSLPDTSGYPVKEKELKMRIALASCHIAIGGYSSKEARHSYELSESLAKETGNASQLLKAQFGLETYSFMSGDFERALELAESCHHLATIAYNKLDDTVSQRHRIRCVISLAQACWSIGNVLFHQARFDKALPHMNRCLSFCDTIDVENRPMAQDPAVMCLAYKSWHYWECGAPDQALSTVEAAVDLARRGGRSFSIGLALAFHACIHLFRQEYSAVIVIASESIAICEEPGFCTWLAWAKVLRGRALSAHADTRRAGIAEIQDGLKMWDDSGAIATRAFTLALLAEACQLDGQQATAFRYITEARHFVEHYGERYYEAEINRIYANLLLSYSPAGTPSVHDTAVDVFRSAISFASERGMHSSVVRSMTDLCRVKCRVEPDLPSMSALQLALAAMSDGDDTGDIRAARQLLRTLETSVRRDSTCE